MPRRTGCFQVPRAVAAHAGFVGRRQRRQARAGFMAAAALVLGGLRGVVGPRMGDARLGVRIVAGAAALIILIGLQRLPAMAPRPQLGEDRIVAAGALLRAEEAAGQPIDIGRIRVQRRLADYRRGSPGT